MKKQLLMALAIVVLSLLSFQNYAQAPPLGMAADYVLFTTVGAVGNTGISQITGNVGTNSGAITIYVNVNGVLHTSDGSSAQCAADLLIAYNQLNATIPTFFPAPLLGNGQVLNAGVYQTTGASTLSNELILDAQNDPDAVFIIQIEGPFSTAANSSVTLVNGALACNVFWKIEGLVDIASGTTMRGTVIANNAAINLNAGVTLEGRALSTAGAVNATGVLAYTPIGCGSPVLMGPAAPDLVSAACYAIFSSNGPVTNAGISYVTGDIGTNVGLTTGFNPLFVTGMIHPIPDGSTAAAAADLLNAYNFLNVIPYDIELMYPAQFGNNLVLTPHTYILNAATTLTDTLYLNGGGQADAVFVIQIFGALSTSTYSKVILTNGTLPENVYWNVNGAVSINDYSVFKGTVIANNGAVNLATGVNIDGRAFTTTGAIETAAVTVTMPPGCASALPPEIITEPENQVVCEDGMVSFSVLAAGDGLTYQWRKGLVGLMDGGNISGSATTTLTLNPVSLLDAASDYNVVVTGTYPPADTSENVSLTVETAPEITAQPTDQIASVGGSASFSVLASGDGLTYQWRKGIIALADGGNISGATSAMLTINPVGLADAALDYNVVITGNCAPDATSDDASLTISVSPIIITEPENQVVCEDGMVSFSVLAAGDGLTYQWRKGLVELMDGDNISGSATTTLTLNPVSLLDAATDYNVVVTGTYLPAATSENVSLTVQLLPDNVFAGDDATVYGTNPFTLSAATAENYSSLLWTSTGDGTFEYETDLNPTYTPGLTDPGTTVTLCLHVEQIAPCDGLPYVDCMDLFVQSIQLEPVANAGEDQDICENQVVNLIGDAQNYSSVHWSGGDGVFSAPNSLVTNYTPGPGDILAGTAELCLTAAPIAPATSSDVDCLSLTIQALPDNVSAGTDMIVCDDVLTIGLTGTASNYASVSWSGGNGFFNDEDLTTFYYVDPADVTAGTITLCLTVIPVAPCQGSVVDCITITFDPSPTISELQDATICADVLSYCFTGITAANYSSLLWSGGDGSFDDPNALNPCYTPGTSDVIVGDVILTLTAQPMGECTIPVAKSMTLHIAADPTIELDDEMYLACADYDFVLEQWLPVGLAPVVTNASSVLWTTNGDGFFDHPDAALTSYNVGMTDKWNSSVTLTLTANGDDNCGVIVEASIILYIPQQIIEVLPGTYWRGISSYVDKSTSSVADVMDPVVVVPGSQSLVMMINKQGKYYWPGHIPAVNQLGLWQPIGYKAKFKAEGCLPIYGDEPYDVVDQTIAVSGAISYVPCLTNYPVAINDLFDGFEDQILLIYSWEEGTMWVPDPNVISPLNFIRPGSAYMMVNRTGANYSVTFPPFDYTASIVANAAVPPAGTDYGTPWNAAVNTSQPHFILFANEVIGTMQAGDIVGAFDKYNECVGTTEITLKNDMIKLLAMGDDPSTEAIDGFQENENMTFKLYRPSTGETFDVTFTYDANYPSYDNKFEVYGVSKVAGMTTTLTSLGELVANRSVNVYPNPANEVINIASDYDLRKVTLVNYVGQTVFSQAVDGNNFQINVSGFVSGIYFVHIETAQGNVVTKPISIQ